MVKSAAEGIEENRKPAAKDNPFLAFQEQMSKQIVHVLDSWRDSQEALSEAIFLNVYGSPLCRQPSESIRSPSRRADGRCRPGTPGDA